MADNLELNLWDDDDFGPTLDDHTEEPLPRKSDLDKPDDKDSEDTDDQEDVVEIPEDAKDKPKDKPNDEEDSLEIPLDEEEKEDVDEKPDNEVDETDENEGIKIYYDFLKDQGVIVETEEDEEFDGTEEQLVERLERSKEYLLLQAQETVLADLQSKLPDEFIDLLNYGLEGGSSLDEFREDQLLNFSEDQLEEDENIQRRVLQAYYKAYTKFSDKRIETSINKLIESGEVVNEIKDAYEAVNQDREKRRQEKQRAIQEAEAAREEQIKEQTKLLKSTINEADYIPAKNKKGMEDFMLKVVDTEMGKGTAFNYRLQQVLSNPQHILHLAQILQDYNPKEGFDFSRFEKQTITKTTKKLKAKLAEAKKNSGLTKLKKSADVDDKDNKKLDLRRGTLSLG